MKTNLSIIIACLFVSACCLKKKCDEVQQYPEIVVEFKGFDSTDLSEVTIITVEASTKKKIDSVVYNAGNNIYGFPNWTIEDPEQELKDYSFIINTNISSDTIYHIDYKKLLSVHKCSSCFIFWDDTDMEVDYQDLSYRHKKKIHTDTLVIKK